ncbi:hypothetical protein B0H13DRAFT_1855034 [Mycena leptocephala]|nr:hypothetical protein B0H13DRAFT_1855034 [Mycena leptocephala]
MPGLGQIALFHTGSTAPPPYMSKGKEKARERPRAHQRKDNRYIARYRDLCLTAKCYIYRLEDGVFEQDANFNNENWWKTTTMDHLQSFNDVLPLITEIFDLAQNAQITFDLCFDKLKKHVLSPLDRIRILAAFVAEDNSAQGLGDFDGLIAVGPGGIATTLPVFSVVYHGLAALRSTVSFTENARTVVSEIRQMSGCLLTCVRYLRTRLFRGLFDPKGGFRELAVLLESSAAARILPMLSEIVSQGEFDLKYFYRYVMTPFLDDVNRDDYQEIYHILSKCCLGLARKVSSRLKVRAHGRRVLRRILKKGPRNRYF